MKNRLIIDRDYLKERLNYDPNTGLFIWKKVHMKKLVGQPAGKIDKHGYKTIKIDGIGYKASRLAYVYIHNEMPKIVDHINGNRLDDRISNLRASDYSRNAINTKVRSHNKSGVTGVCFVKNRWIAQISIDGNNKYLGSFVSFSDAVDARKNAEVLYGYSEYMRSI